MPISALTGLAQIPSLCITSCLHAAKPAACISLLRMSSSLHSWPLHMLWHLPRQQGQISEGKLESQPTPLLSLPADQDGLCKSSQLCPSPPCTMHITKLSTTRASLLSCWHLMPTWRSLSQAPIASHDTITYCLLGVSPPCMHMMRSSTSAASGSQLKRAFMRVQAQTPASPSRSKHSRRKPNSALMSLACSHGKG